MLSENTIVITAFRWHTSALMIAMMANLKSWIGVGKEKNNDNGKPKYSFQFNLGGTADHEECGSGNSQG